MMMNYHQRNEDILKYNKPKNYMVDNFVNLYVGGIKYSVRILISFYHIYHNFPNYFHHSRSY